MTNWPAHISKCISLNDFFILNKISLTYILYGLIDNKSTLVQVMDWCLTKAEMISIE